MNLTERPAMDVTNTALQNAIAESLLGDESEQPQAEEQPESEYAVSGADLLDEAIAEQESNVLRHGDNGMTHRLEEQPEAEVRQPQERLRSERAPEEKTEQQEQRPPTPEEVQAGVEKLDSAVKEFGLDSPSDYRQFADEFTAAFGTDVYKAGVDVGALGGVMAKTALSAFQVYEVTKGDLSKMGAIPEQNAQAFAFDFLKGMGIDPRSMPVDSSLLARTVLGGAVNFIKTCESYGWKITDLSKINNPETAEFYLGHFLKALGVEGQVNRETAIKFADAFGKQMLRVWGKLSEAQAQRAAAQQPRTKGQRGPRVPAGLREGIRGSKAPRFKTNQEVFDSNTMDYYHQQHGRL
jgi:hypothetical protein